MARFRHALLLSAFAAAALVALVDLRYRNELRSAYESAGEGLLVNLPGGPVEYGEKGSGVPLLSVHGAGGGYDQGLDNAADLVGQGFRVIAPSRFGYLGTPIPHDPSAASQAQAHAELLANLQIPKAVVVGVSAGARSALELAIRHPDRVAALILIVPGTYSPTSPVSVEASRGSKFAFWLVNHGADFFWWAAEKVAPSILIRFVGVSPELVAASSAAEQARIRQIVENIQPLSLRFAGISLDSNPDPRWPRLEDIAAPTLVISAKDDLFNTLPAAEFAARGIPGAKLVVYETGGHLLVGRQQEVRKVIRDFLAKVSLAP